MFLLTARFEGMDYSANPIITDKTPGRLRVTWPLKGIDDTLKIEFTEKRIEILVMGNEHLDWFLDFTSGVKPKLPFTPKKDFGKRCFYYCIS